MAIPYGRQFLFPEDTQAVLRALESEALTSGPAVTEFESALCKVTGAKHCIAVASGTAALHLVCLARGLKSGDRGLTTPITFVASSNCFEYCGARSDFIDIDPDRLCISPAALDEYCRTRGAPAIVTAVSFAGIPCDLPALRELSQKHGFFLIEDAAHALGSTYQSGAQTYQCASCAHSDAAILSFHPVKTVTTAEGGAITTNDDNLAARIRLLRSHGIERDPAKLSRQEGGWYHEMIDLGFHYRITDLQCALGSSQLKHLALFKNRRAAIVARYNEAFRQSAQLITVQSPDSVSPCFHLYVLQFQEGSKRRRAAYDYLRSKDIHPQVHYIPVYWQPYYQQRYGFPVGKCPNAETYYNRCLSLPLHFGLEDSEIERVIATVREALERPLV